MSGDANSTVLGVLVLARHGDRQGFYQDPNTYAASATRITPLGNQQHVQLGGLLRALYLNASSPSNIAGLNGTALFDPTQVAVSADAGDEGGVIYDSAVSLTQGMWPATSAYNTTLANGTTVVGPLSGYQYVPVASVESSNDVSLEGFTSCATFTNYVNAFYNSSEFAQKTQESASFLGLLKPYLDGRPVVLKNMWNIFDYMNVQSIHNATFLNDLPGTYLAQARALANWHQYNSFSAPQLDSVGNIAARTALPSMITGLQRIANASDALKVDIIAISYKPFLSLFNMTGVAEANPSLAGIVDYAAAVALEVRQASSGGEPVLRFNFKNGTADAFHTYNLFGSDGDVPLASFVSALAPAAVNTTAEWCGVCANTQDRGCGALALAAAQAKTHQKISPVGAGFLGAGLTVAVLAMALGVLAFLGVLVLGRRSRRAVAVAPTEKKQQGSYDGSA